VKPKLSVVIPCKEPTYALELCLDSLTRQWPIEIEAEIFVVDDGSNANFESFTMDFIPPVIVLHAEQQQGAGSCRNLGVQASSAEIVAFIDDDCLIPYGWTSAVLEYMDQNPDCALAGGHVLSVNQRNVFSRATEDCVIKPKMVNGVANIVTANAFVRRTEFLQSGGFDGAFKGAGGEDFELSRRMDDLGFQVSISKEIYCYHWNPTTLKSFLERSWRYGVWSRKLGELTVLEGKGDDGKSLAYRRIASGIRTFSSVREQYALLVDSGTRRFRAFTSTFLYSIHLMVFLLARKISVER